MHNVLHPCCRGDVQRCFLPWSPMLHLVRGELHPHGVIELVLPSSRGIIKACFGRWALMPRMNSSYESWPHLLELGLLKHLQTSVLNDAHMVNKSCMIRPEPCTVNRQWKLVYQRL